MVYKTGHKLHIVNNQKWYLSTYLLYNLINLTMSTDVCAHKYNELYVRTYYNPRNFHNIIIANC